MIIDIQAHLLTKEIVELPGTKDLYEPYRAIFQTEVRPVSIEQMIAESD